MEAGQASFPCLRMSAVKGCINQRSEGKFTHGRLSKVVQHNNDSESVQKCSTALFSIFVVCISIRRGVIA
jgi:hypothetical protein